MNPSRVPGPDDAEVLREILAEVNALRARLGLGMLRHSRGLTRAAHQQLTFLCSRSGITHEGVAGASFQNRLEFAGCFGLSARECLGRNFLSAPQLVHAWLQSSSHARNLKWDQAVTTGIALGTVYERSTQLYVRICVLLMGDEPQTTPPRYAARWLAGFEGRIRYAKTVSALANKCADRIMLDVALSSEHDVVHAQVVGRP